MPRVHDYAGLVIEGRDMLTPAEVRQLADGSIYGATEAMEKKLIDHIGYMDDAIELAKSLAGVEEARVVELKKSFSITDFLSAQTNSLSKFGKTVLNEFAIPQLHYLWVY